MDKGRAATLLLDQGQTNVNKMKRALNLQLTNHMAKDFGTVLDQFPWRSVAEKAAVDEARRPVPEAEDAEDIIEFLPGLQEMQTLLSYSYIPKSDGSG
jgi:hypothetical protein